MDTLTTLPEILSAVTAQDELPRGSALLCETILTLSRKIQKLDELDKIKIEAAGIESMAKELVEKCKRQMGVV